VLNTFGSKMNQPNSWVESQIINQVDLMQSAQQQYQYCKEQDES
jgi:hypothetical protein